MNKKANKTGFTLIEVMVSLFLSVMVAFFVYTMMISSYTAYRRLSSVSKNANSIRYFITNISNSIKYCDGLPVEETSAVHGKCLVFRRYDQYLNENVKEKYYFSGGLGYLIKSSSCSVNVNTASYYSSSLGLLKKDICRLDDTVIESVTVSNIIRAIYFDWVPATLSTANAERAAKMHLGVIYDDVIDGRVNQSSGKIELKNDGSTEWLNSDTLGRRLFCFCFRGFDVNG